MVWSHPQYTEYEVSIYSKVVGLWFTKSSVSAAELNLELKTQANNIRISPNLTYGVISLPIDWIWSFNWFWGGLIMVHQELFFCCKNWTILEISTNPSLFLFFFLFNILIWFRDSNKMKYNTFWCEPRDHATHNQDWHLFPESRNRSDRSVTQ